LLHFNGVVAYQIVNLCPHDVRLGVVERGADLVGPEQIVRVPGGSNTSQLRLPGDHLAFLLDDYGDRLGVSHMRPSVNTVEIRKTCVSLTSLNVQ
jgi:hypothetical protein